MKPNKLFYGYLATIISVILWGASFIWTTDLIQVCNFPVVTIVLLRISIAALLMFLFLKVDKINKGDFKYFLALAFFQPFLYFIGETYGVKYIGEASFPAVMVAFIPVVTPIALGLFYKKKQPYELFLGASISVIGVVVMSFGVSHGGSVSIVGVLFLCFAIASAIFYNVFLQKLLYKGYKPITITAYQNLLALIFYIPLFLSLDLKEFIAIDWSLRAICDVLCLAVLCSCIAYTCYTYGARTISVEKELMFENAIPIVTIIISLSIGQELLNAQKILGMIVVILGLTLSQSDLSKRLKKSK